MSENLKIYNALKQPPREALKTIQGGRLSGKTDISPQWRYKALTEQFGVCGSGWKYEVVRVWSELIEDGQMFAFAEIKLYFKLNNAWSEPIPGFGGSMLITKEQAGLHANDEGYKMAITDALSTAMKMLGVAADIYSGLWDGTKYKTEPSPATPKPPSDNAQTPQSQETKPSNNIDLKELREALGELEKRGQIAYQPKSFYSFVRSKYNTGGKTDKEIIGKLTQAQANEVWADIQKAISKLPEDNNSA